MLAHIPTESPISNHQPNSPTGHPGERQLRIHLLGDFRLLYGSQPVTTIRADRVQTLLAYLLLHRRAPQPRQHIAFTLWPDTSEGQARSNLRNLLHSLRNALPDADRFLSADTLTLGWREDAPFWLDVAAFEAALDAADANDSERYARLAEAVELYGGELLPGNYEDWLIPWRDELRGGYEDALRQLIALLEADGQYREALQYATRLLHQDPVNETTYVQLMRLHALSGDRAGVRRIFEQCVAVLERELAVEPSPATHSAYQELLRMDVVHPTPAPQNLVLDAQAVRQPLPLSPGPLPVPGTPFVGREGEVRDIAALLSNSACRLLTLTGLGGIGKTRLALQVAQEQQGRFRDGVAFVPLAGITAPDGVVAAIASAVGHPGSDMRLAQNELLTLLADRQILLVLDNAEQLIEQLDMVVELLARAPAATVLVTSRERLHLREEWVFEVEGLPVPPLTEEGEDTVSEEGAAITLFLQCARRTHSAFDPTPEDARYIRQICHLVGGMPLGIELAAAWVHVLSCREIAREIERNLDFLATPMRNVPERHRTMRAVFEHSWALLTDEEQRVMRQLSVFRRGFAREMAEPVANATLPVLAALTDKSLLRRNSNGRYEMHERVRQFAYRKLHEANEASAVLDRHLAAYRAMAEANEMRLFAAARAETLQNMDLEQANVRVALEWGLQNDETYAPPERTNAGERFSLPRRLEDAIALAATMVRGWYLNGHIREGQEWISLALGQIEPWVAVPQAADSIPLQTLYAKLLLGAGDLEALLDQYARAEECLKQSRALFQRLGLPRGAVLSLHRLSETIMAQGRLGEIEPLLQESLTLSRSMGDDWLVARSLATLAILALEQGDTRRSIELANESMSIFRRLREMGAVGQLLNILGQIALGEEDPERATGFFQEVLALDRQAYRPNRDGQAWTLRNLGQAAQMQGRYAQAVQYFQQSMVLRQQLGQPVGVAWSIEGLAEVAAETDQWQRAARLWGYAAHTRSTTGSHISTFDRARFEQLRDRVRAQLGDEAFQAAWTAGERMPPDQAAAYALLDESANQ